MENEKLRQISQEELNEILEQHELWLETRFTEEVKGKCADLSNGDLSNGDLRDADLSNANLCYANLCGADLCGADLSNADLINANLCYANLCGADLRGANLVVADLSYADLSYVNLTGANLCYANLRGANLRGANLGVANLGGANLRGADLRYTNLTGANLDFSCFPLWCGGLNVKIDDKQAIQLLYHLVRNVQYSDSVSEELKKLLLQPQIVAKANEFHRVEECGKIENYLIYKVRKGRCGEK